jgi:hypothetical protein
VVLVSFYQYHVFIPFLGYLATNKGVGVGVFCLLLHLWYSLDCFERTNAYSAIRTSHDKLILQCLSPALVLHALPLFLELVIKKKKNQSRYTHQLLKTE